MYAPEGQQTISNYFNASNVVIPSPSQPFGDAPRSAARGPAIYTRHLGLHKSVSLVGRSRLELRVEAFNLLNRSNVNAPNGNRSATSFGTIASLAGDPRQIQLGVKVDF